MKKSLLAIAIAAAVPAVASAQVVVSGIIKGGVASTTYSNGASGNGSGMAVNDGSSRFILSATEKIGTMSAFFQMDTRFRVDDNGGAPSSSPLASGNTFVGLGGGFGSIQIGKMDTHYCSGSDQHGSRATALTHSSCTLLGYVSGNGANTAIANASRSSNVIRYTSPTMNGLTLQLNHSTAWGAAGSEGVVDNPGKGGATHGQLTYSGQGIVAGVSSWDARSEDKGTGQKGQTIWGSYQAGPLNIGLTYDTSSAGLGASKAERTVTSVPVRFAMGATTFLGTWSKASNAEIGGKDTAGSGATLYSVGIAHDLSKRTSIGVSYGNLNNGAAAQYVMYTQAGLSGHANTSKGQDMEQFYLGVRHTF
jgi:predicted porin